MQWIKNYIIKAQLDKHKSNDAKSISKSEMQKKILNENNAL